MKRHLFFLILFVALAVPVRALTVGGVDFPATLQRSNETLKLNGAGLRSKFFVKVYAGGLYVGRPQTDAGALLADPGAKVIRMVFIHSRVGRDKIVSAFREGLEKNAPLVLKSPATQTFFTLFADDFVAGDTVDLDLGSDGTVTVRKNGKDLGTVRDPALPAALLAIYLGREPADADLKRGLLGQH